MSATTAVRAAGQRGAAAVDAPASATQIHAQADVATTEVMREALEAVGEDEFRRRAQAKIEALSRHGRFAVIDILPALKDRDSYCARAGVEPVRVASVGSCFVEAAGAGGAAAGARLTSSPQAAGA